LWGIKVIDAFGKDSWKVTNGETEVYITGRGAQLGPVTFFSTGGSPIRPYYVSPWNLLQDINGPLEPPVLDPLRGDFLCLPFGADNQFKKENHPIHGECAGNEWHLLGQDEADGVASIRLGFEPKERKGTITKELSLVRGQSVIYQSHRIDGFAGPTTIAHHAILSGDTPLHLDTAPLALGVTDGPGEPYHDAGEYYCLSRERTFDSLERVPSVWSKEPLVDVSRFPAREGFVDIVQVVPDYSQGRFGWFTATAPEAGWLWFSLKDKALLPSTVLWMENRGRHTPPWNGRNRCIGIEDACSYLATGLGPSVRTNPLSLHGIPTWHSLTADRPFIVNYVQGVCRIPHSFDRVASVRIEDTSIRFRARSGADAEVAVNTSFVLTGHLS